MIAKKFSEARLNALRMQLDPHFLFNALNTVSSQVEREPKLARRMIEHLGDLLRLSLNSQRVHEISLAEELVFLDHYLAIQMIRFGDALKIEMRIAPDVKDALVPSLFIQPLVENAIRHGISKRARGGLIVLSAQRFEEKLLIQVLMPTECICTSMILLLQYCHLDHPALAGESSRRTISLVGFYSLIVTPKTCTGDNRVYHSSKDLDWILGDWAFVAMPVDKKREETGNPQVLELNYS